MVMDTQLRPVSGRAHGDCETCEIALLFEMGRFSQVNLDLCSECIRENRPQKFKIRGQIDQMLIEGEEKSQIIAQTQAELERKVELILTSRKY
jgi:hypothetical protein